MIYSQKNPIPCKELLAGHKEEACVNEAGHRGEAGDHFRENPFTVRIVRLVEVLQRVRKA